MNKAFVREPDPTDCVCPRCQVAGVPVPNSTVQSFVPLAKQAGLSASAYFCETPNCEVAYFDALESIVLAIDLTRAVYPKDVAAPLCGCFGLTEEDVRQDIDDGKPLRIRDLLQKSKTDAAHCSSADPQGTCCLPRVQKLYFKLIKR